MLTTHGSFETSSHTIGIERVGVWRGDRLERRVGVGAQLRELAHRRLAAFGFLDVRRYAPRVFHRDERVAVDVRVHCRFHCLLFLRRGFRIRFRLGGVGSRREAGWDAAGAAGAAGFLSPHAARPSAAINTNVEARALERNGEVLMNSPEMKLRNCCCGCVRRRGPISVAACRIASRRRRNVALHRCKF